MELLPSSTKICLGLLIATITYLLASGPLFLLWVILTIIGGSMISIFDRSYARTLVLLVLLVAALT